MVLLIGNYSADQQQSMQRFNTMMLQGLNAAGKIAKPGEQIVSRVADIHDVFHGHTVRRGDGAHGTRFTHAFVREADELRVRHERGGRLCNFEARMGARHH